ncbi:CPCC family cysteine-rich protein [Anaerosacchariphilus polymeriproducens]|uniref:Glycosyltransferase n=1 Tax=Anaerosacchariphilus polymeriproducens TaxID=1812858 RepID=A0A371ASS8_9FIRM|nr:CPCC family cysteine-rich protein [Anaerosacchariphilus polymeriproducens]RDU22592.1 glycosyltransferase [Anaerosacchariphilus polymeriproducens]
MRRCPCCGYLTIDDSEEIITDICEVCFWQYDEVAHNKPDVAIGANKISLNEAKENYKLFGACEQRFVSSVRQPLNDEL